MNITPDNVSGKSTERVVRSEVSLNTDKIQLLIRERRFNDAIQMCEKFIVQSENLSYLDPPRKTALHFIGTCNYLEGNLGKAIEVFKTILSQDPKHTDAAISLSIIYNDIGRYDDAKKIYQVANQSLQLKRQGADLLLDRKFALKHIELGDLYFKFHRYDDALDDYAKASRLDPKNLDLRIKMAKVYAKKGFTTRSIQELQQLCYEDPNYIPARVHLGLMYFSQGNVIDAQIEWEKARAQDPHNAELKTYLDMARQAKETQV